MKIIKGISVIGLSTIGMLSLMVAGSCVDNPTGTLGQVMTYGIIGLVLITGALFISRSRI